MQTVKPNMAAWVAALLAVLLLNYASVVSSTMQVEMALPGAMGPLCAPPTAPASPSAAKAASGRPLVAHPQTSHEHPAVCAFCSAAMHAPTLGSVLSLRPSVAVLFAGYSTVSALGPRGPPALEPRARGPPSDLTPL